MRPKKVVTQKDVAKELGISAVTVSNALSGKPGVSPELRQRIIGCAEEKGLKYSRVENRTLVKDKPEEDEGILIGTVVLKRYISVGTSFYWEMYQKTAYAASERHCLTSLIIIEEDSVEMEEAPDFLQKDIEGLILIGPFRTEFVSRVKQSFHGPVVLMDQQIEDQEVSSVLSGNYWGMYRSVKELIRAGHTEIGFVGALTYSRNIIDRYYGFKKCMRENGLPVHSGWVLPDRTGPEETGGVVLPEKLPTAFATSSDYAAGHLYYALQSRGLSVPEDISIASYDDYLYDHPLSGHLTTYHVDMDKMAKCAVKLLLREQKDPMSAGVIYEVDSRMVIRDSILKVISE